MKNPSALDQPAAYEIQMEGQLSPHRLEYFSEFNPTTGLDAYGRSITTLAGTFIDQAALLGTIQNLYNLGMVLIHVQRVEK